MCYSKDVVFTNSLICGTTKEKAELKSYNMVIPLEDHCLMPGGGGPAVGDITDNNSSHYTT